MLMQETIIFDNCRTAQRVFFLSVRLVLVAKVEISNFARHNIEFSVLLSISHWVLLAVLQLLSRL